jgi:hypothetical protein
MPYRTLLFALNFGSGTGKGAGMSITSRVITAALALSVVTGVGAAGALTANAATTKCGALCTDLFSVAQGKGDLINVVDQVRQVGQPVNLAKAADTNPGEDFVASYQGLVSDLYQAGIISAGLDKLYPKLQVIEIQYWPAGKPTVLCLGVATTPGVGTPVTLQTCGATASTTWIVDPVTRSSRTYDELISGATAGNFQHPYVLTAGSPGEQLVTATLAGGDPALTYQLWGSIEGAIPAS